MKLNLNKLKAKKREGEKVKFKKEFQQYISRPTIRFMREGGKGKQYTRQHLAKKNGENILCLVSVAELEPEDPKLFWDLKPEPNINFNKHFLQSVWRMLE